MEFQASLAIYLQIAEFIEEEILRGHYIARLPAVRELATLLKVNPNTAMRAYAYLESQGIIASTRGIGYFVAEQAHEKILALRKAKFLNEMAPAFIKDMDLLGVTWEEIRKL